MDRETEPKKPEDPKPTAGEAGEEPSSAEVGGREGPEPTRYGDWEVGGICTDF